MTVATSAELIREARTRLVLAAEGHRSYRGPYDPGRLTGTSCDLLWRWALAIAAAAGRLEQDRPVLDLLLAVAKGDAGALDDAAAAGGVGPLVGDDRPPPATVGEVEAALDALVTGGMA